MAPDPRCTALAAAMKKTGDTYATLAAKVGLSEQHVIDICTGSDRPTDAEFHKLSEALGISDSEVPHTGVHSTK